MILYGDCLIKLMELEDNSVDAIVTDPPYGLKFMGKSWDYDVPSTGIWKECLRVLKPGGHLLSFAGTRTYHRMAVNIEDAGFEIRDQIQWLYGSGFPKSHDVSKGIDKQAGIAPTRGRSKGTMPVQTGDRLCPKAAHEEARHYEKFDRVENFEQLPTSEAAKQWQGWGTALKPANEPICLARKPVEKGLTIAENVLKWGVGGINIDGCRIVTQEKLSSGRHTTGDQQGPSGYKTTNRTKYEQNNSGRWPANIILDETAAAILDEQSGVLKSGGISRADSDGASRFFYVAKASTRERNHGLEDMPDMRSGTERMNNSDGRKKELGESDRLTLTKNGHPTVKPIKLMEYLCKLIVPPRGIVLDPFMGSGSTGIAAKNLDLKFIGIEREKEYLEIAERRISNCLVAAEP